MSLDLEALRHIFQDNRTWISIGKITKLSVATDRSVLRCMVSMLDWNEQPEIVAKMTWDQLGVESGCLTLPSVNDLVIVCFAEGDVEQAFIIRKLSAKDDKIPKNAVEGHTVLKSMQGKNLWLTSDSKINLSKGDTAPTENVVLGQQLKALLSDILTQIADLAEKVSTHTHPGNLGYPTGAPMQAADFVSLKSEVDNLKSSPVGDEKILSKISFTD